MVIPSFYNSLHDPAVYPDPEHFLHERWMDPSSSANNTNPKNYLVFGAGPRHCVGLKYATMNIALVTVKLIILPNSAGAIRNAVTYWGDQMRYVVGLG